jgi:arylsulfatase A-like enzyme
VRKIAASGDRAQGKAPYAALVESVDASVGRLRTRLDELNLCERTIIVFTSDNGGLIGQTTNLGLRAGKGSAFEGGVRVPAIVRVPGVTRAGGECATPVITMDWTATLIELAGAPTLPDQHGVSLVPLLKGGTIAPRPLFWHYPHYHPGGATPHSAIRDGDWKLVEFFEDQHVELYNLLEDPAEKRDLAAGSASQAAALRRRLHEWRGAMSAQLPRSNPNSDPARDSKPPGR